MLNEMRKKNPKQFWNFFKKKKKSASEHISLNEFYDHFQSLASETSLWESEDVESFLKEFDDKYVGDNDNQEQSSFPELDIAIT